MKWPLFILCGVAIALAGCTTSELARLVGRRECLSVVVTEVGGKKAVAGLPVMIEGLVAAFPMAKRVVISEGTTDASGCYRASVPVHFAYHISAGPRGALFGSESGFYGYTWLDRDKVPAGRPISVEVEWRQAPSQNPE